MAPYLVDRRPDPEAPRGACLGRVERLAFSGLLSKARYGRGMPRSLQILATSRSAISVCRGTAEVAPVVGRQKIECRLPSRSNSQPCRLRCVTKAWRFMRSGAALPG